MSCLRIETNHYMPSLKLITATSPFLPVSPDFVPNVPVPKELLDGVPKRPPPVLAEVLLLLLPKTLLPNENPAREV